MLNKRIARTMKRLTGRSALAVEQGQTQLADTGDDSDEARLCGTLQAATCTDRIAFGLHEGHTVLAVPSLPSPRRPPVVCCAQLPILQKRCMQVSIAEDDPDRQALLQLLMQSAEHSVTVFGSVAESIEALKKERFEMLLVD
jgi:hypothetical protein